VVYPAKGLVARDLALVCHYQGLPLVARPGLGPSTRPSVNALSAAFVEVLQSNVPSAVSTIHRTAARLQVCAFVHHAFYRVIDRQVPSCSRRNEHLIRWRTPEQGKYSAANRSGFGAGVPMELAVAFVRR